MKTLHETGTTLQKWLVRKHGKIKAGRTRNKDKNTFHNTLLAIQTHILIDELTYVDNINANNN